MTESTPSLITAAQAGQILGGLSAWSIHKMRRAQKIDPEAVVEIGPKTIRFRRDVIESYATGRRRFGEHLLEN